MNSFSLGLDIGSNSLGWAMVNDRPTPDGQNLVTGVRIFPEGVENDGKAIATAASVRRRFRQARRQLDRRARRQRQLRAILRKAGILPADEDKMKEILARDPYILRCRGLEEELCPEQFGRALLSLNERRGFRWSPASSPDEQRESDKEQKEKTTATKEAMKSTKGVIESIPGMTVGKWLCEKKYGPYTEWKSSPRPPKPRRHESLRCRAGSEWRFTRDLYETEFQALWEKQSSFRPEIWTGKLRGEVHEAIFGQRPLKSQKRLIAKCTLEEEEGRCHRSSWFAVQFRLLQEVANLRIVKGHGRNQERWNLTTEQRKAVLEEMGAVKERSFDSLAELLSLAESETLNLAAEFRDEETGETLLYREELKGNHVEAGLQDIFPDFDARPDFYREEVWAALLDAPDTFQGKAREWGLTEEQVHAVADEKKIERQGGYVKFSLKAIKKLNERMEEGMDLHGAIEKEYPHYREELTRIGTGDRLPPVKPDDYRNTVVVRALTETRKVVNQIVREHGMPSRIVIELAREAKHGVRLRNKIMEKIHKNERRRTAARKWLAEHHQPETDRNIEKWLLWEEVGKFCPYCDQPLSCDQLWGGGNEAEIDHILPRYRSLDNRFMNKTLCHTHCNRDKLNRTPREAWERENPAKYRAVLAFVKKSKNMPPEKRKRFSMREAKVGEFCARQLTDTSYIARAAVDYLRSNLAVEKIQVRSGVVTGNLRREWGLNSILGREEGTAARAAEEDKSRKKNREDYRHHAVDAVVLAMARQPDIELLQERLRDRALRNRKPDERDTSEKMPPPFLWREHGVVYSEFRSIVRKALSAVVVSHRPQRKLSGTITGMTNYRWNETEQRYEYRGKDGETKKAKRKEMIPIYSKKEPQRSPERGNARYVEPGDNHHVAIYRCPDPEGDRQDSNGQRYRLCARAASRFALAQTLTQNKSANREARTKSPEGQAYERKRPVIVSPRHPDYPNSELVVSLCKGDMVLFDRNRGIGGDSRTSRIFKLVGIGGGESGNENSLDLWFWNHAAVPVERPKEREKREIWNLGKNLAWVRIRSTSRRGWKSFRKVDVDPLGNVHLIANRHRRP